MESAFGIDHGYEEIEKAVPGMGMLRQLGTGIAGKTMGAGVKNISAGAGRAVKTPGTGAKQMGFGRKLTELGHGMAKRPGLTGGVAAGGGVAGIGGGGALMANRRQR